jgi:hypothetical protein
MQIRLQAIETALGSPSAPVTSRSAIVNFTRPNDTTAYAANDVIGVTGGNAGIHSFAIGSSAAEKLMLISALLRIDLAAVPAGMAGFRLHMFNDTPDAVADNAAFVLSSAGDRGKYLGYLDFALPTVNGATLLSQTAGINLQLPALVATTLYGQLQTLGGYTPAAQTTFSIQLNAIKP